MSYQRPSEVPESPDVTTHYRARFAGFPDACRLSDGDILVVFREDSIHTISETGKVVCVRSKDGGKTWGEPVMICDHPGRDDRDPGILQTSDGTIWVGLQSQRYRDYQSYLIRSLDSGHTWEEPILISDPEYFPVWPEVEMSNGEVLWIGSTAPAVVLPNGELRWVAGTYGCKRCTFILREAGEGFQMESFVHPNLGPADEWTVVETTPGTLVAILRQQPAEYYYQSKSTDYGRTWAPAWPTSVWQTSVYSRPKLCKINDKTLILAYAERARHRIVAVPSFDGGQTWRTDRIVTILDNEDYCSTEDYDFGYSVCVKVGSERYLFIYYAHPGHHSPHKGIFGNFVETTRFQP